MVPTTYLIIMKLVMTKENFDCHDTDTPTLEAVTYLAIYSVKRKV